MPAFFLYYEKGELVGLLTVYADDQDVEVTILVHPEHRRQGIARALFTSFEKETALFYSFGDFSDRTYFFRDVILILSATEDWSR